MHCFLLQDPLKRHLTALERMVALLAAITHDIDHPGVNQAFLIATSDPLATLYKNISVLENHHWRFAVSLLQSTGVFAHLPTVQWQTLVSKLRSLILATDITCQQHYLATFKSHLDANDLNLADNEQDRHFVLQMALKCADISNPCRPWEISRKWSEYVCDEFFRQGDRERMLHLPVTAICDRHSTSIAQIQIGFMKYVVSPLYAQWYRFVPSRLSAVMLHNVTTNASCWEAIVAECARHPAEEEEETARAAEEERGEDGERREQVPGEAVTSVAEGASEDTEAENKPVSHDTLSISNTSCHTTEPNNSTSEVTSSAHEVQERPQGKGHPAVAHHLHAPLMNGRRLSLPPPRMPASTASSLSNKRLTPDSCNRLRSRRHTVANGNDNDVRFEAMVDRLTALAECIASDEAPAGDGQRTPTASPRLPSIGNERLQSFTQESDRQSSAHGLSMSADSHERLAAKRITGRAGTDGSNSRRYSDMKLGGQASRIYPAALLAGGKHLKHQSSLPSFSPTLARRRPTDATVTTTAPAPCHSNDNVFHVSRTGQAVSSVLAKEVLLAGPRELDLDLNPSG